MDCNCKEKSKCHHNVGFTNEEFLEVVDFFRELIRLDRKGQVREKLVHVLRLHLQNLIKNGNKI